MTRFDVRALGDRQGYQPHFSLGRDSLPIFDVSETAHENQQEITHVATMFGGHLS